MVCGGPLPDDEVVPVCVDGSPKLIKVLDSMYRERGPVRISDRLVRLDKDHPLGDSSDDLLGWDRSG